MALTVSSSHSRAEGWALDILIVHAMVSLGRSPPLIAFKTYSLGSQVTDY